ncbi:hypothetical protein LCGC14_2877450 [marine sediment metagenome]|uniref:Uncharacterized protein n=1 Tax=marine sediment metagenome TaxID=412755 RepID=A0A0F9A971_9ZZZZ
MSALQSPYTKDAVVKTVNAAAPESPGPRGNRQVTSGPSGKGIVQSPLDSQVPVPGIEETPNSMSGLPLHVEGQHLGSGDPGEGGNVKVPDLSKNNKARTLA